MEKHLIYDFNNDYGREPVIRKTKKGTLLCLCLTGGVWEPENANVVKIQRSFDDGITWTEPELLFKHHSRGVWAPEMFIDDDRIMVIVQTYNAESYYRELQTFYSISVDDGNTWSEPISFPNGINGVSIRQGIQLSNKSYLFPIYYGEVVNNFDWKNVKKWHDNLNFCCGVIISKDKLRSYEMHGYIKSEKCLWEPNCVEVESGHIIMYMRNNNSPYLGISHSYDYGKTWSNYEETNIPNANTKVTLLKIDDLILLISNFNNSTGFKNRTHLQIWISKDGINWLKKIKIEDDDKCFFYPHAFYDKNNKILYIAYENSKQFYLKKIPYQYLVI